MSFIPFVDQNVAAATLSNSVVYKKQVTLPASGVVTVDYPLFTTEANMGQFVASEVWAHIDNNSGVNTLTFTASIGHTAAPYDTVCASAVRGSATLALQYQQYKAVVLATRLASGYYAPAPPAVSYGTPANVATTVNLRVTSHPASQMIITFFVIGYYTGMRP